MSLKHFKKILSLLLVAVMLVGTPGFELCTETVQASEVDVITGFADFDVGRNAYYIGIDDKPATAEELAADMPKQLGVYLNGSSESVLIDVSWFEITGEYADTDYYYYQFSPSWDETKYVLSDSISLLTDAPYIEVYFQENTAVTFSLTNATYEDDIYDYLIKSGYNVAAACGIMANIEGESGLRPDNLQNSYETSLGMDDVTYTEAVNNKTYTKEQFVNDKAGYGLCQWTFWSRKEALYDYAEKYAAEHEIDFDISNYEMQLEYLQNELTKNYGSIYSAIKESYNTKQGAYNVAYLFCYYFEAPSLKEERAITRGNRAKEYWNEYGSGVQGTSSVTVTGHTVPVSMYVGDYFVVKGTVSSKQTIKSVTVSCVDMSGSVKTGYTAKPNSTSYNLKNLDNYIYFDKLTAGNYYYIIEATTASGKTVLEKAIFQVLEKEEPEEGTNSSTTKIGYSTHVKSNGWMSYVYDGNTAGTIGESKRVEAIKISLSNMEYSGSVTYRTHVQDHGWMSWVKDGAVSGTTGESKQVEAIQIKLTGDVADKYDIYYRVHVNNIGWMDWAKNGEVAGTTGQSKQVEAIQMILIEKGKSAPGSTSVPAQLSSQLKYSGHSANVGWGNYVAEGKTAGTTGKSLRLESLKISLNGAAYSGSISYKAHVQNVGWQDWVKDGAVAGTTGQAKRMEAVCIQLSGEIAEYYDVYYRAHVADYGWLDWAKNGQIAGTTGLAKQMEAIQIVLVKKGSAAPGATTTPYRTK